MVRAAPALRVTRRGDRLGLSLVMAGAAWAWLVKDHGRTPYDESFDRASSSSGVPANLLRAIARTESGFRPDAVGEAGELGLMQLTPATLRALGASGSSALDPARAIPLAARVLAENRRTLERAGRFSPLAWAASYNAGPDLEPHEPAYRYAWRVFGHWLGYDLGRVTA